MLDLHDNAEQAAFRARLREWFAANLPAGWADRDPTVGVEDVEFLRAWSAKLYAAGYAGITWPCRPRTRASTWRRPRGTTHRGTSA
jgi:alkylation response protein AidB-like acyl-CoA dehydrogenase